MVAQSPELVHHCLAQCVLSPDRLVMHLWLGHSVRHQRLLAVLNRVSVANLSGTLQPTPDHITHAAPFYSHSLVCKLFRTG